MTKKRPISKAQNTIHNFFKPTGSINTNIAPLSNIEPVDGDSLSDGVQLQAESNVAVLQVEANVEPIQVDLEEDYEQRPSKIQRLEPEEVEANSYFERVPGLRSLIYKYPVNQRDHVRQSYLQMGPYQPVLKPFPPTFDGRQNHFLETVVLFCQKYEIVVPNLHAPHKSGTGRLCHQPDSVPFTVADHYRISLFTSLIDYQLKELSSRFTEEAMELLSLTSSLDPKNAYQAFSIDKICTLATKYYCEDFTSQELYGLRGQLQHYQLDVPSDLCFKSMKTISELCQGLVESGKSNVYPLVDRLIRLVLTLPVSTATTERAFSAMKLIKSQLRTKINDESLADCMVLFIERKFTKSIDVESIVDEFDLKGRRGRFH